jgi:hypothetical protein
VFDVLSIKSFVCLYKTVDADADLMEFEGNKQKMTSRKTRSERERERERERKKKFNSSVMKTYGLFVIHNDEL